MVKKNKKVLIIVASAVLLITVITVAYAYFIASVQTVNEQTVVAETGTMRLVMNDGNTGWSEVWDFGESKSKTFTLQNTGSLPVTVDLYWKNLVNTFLEGSMVYSLKQTTDTSVETYLVGSATTFENIPTSATSVSTNKIAEQITVPANKTYTYILTIQLVNSPTVDQTADLNAEFYTEFDIKEYEPTTIASYIKNNVYGTDATLYLHSDTATGNNETSIANWTDAESGNANDGAFRYSGPDADVHNYICFGTSDKNTCLNDTSDNGNSKYLFRIISVEGDNVKIIKALPLYNTKTSAATFRWDYEGSTDSGTYSNSWSKPSTLKEYLNTGTSSRANYSSNYPDTGYLQSWSSDWQSKIADKMMWYVGGYNTYNVKVKTFYNAEHGTCTSGTCPGTVDTTTKIGLMNVYDYGYAAAPTSWAIKTLYDYDNSTIKTSNWLYRSTNSSTEWTITLNSSNAYHVWVVNGSGYVSNISAYDFYAVRPVFYLASNVAYKSGTGTSTDPFLIS